MATKEADEVIDSSTQHLSVIDYSNITSTGATVKEEPLDVKIEETEETVFEELPMATKEADEVIDSSTQHLSVIDYSNITSTGATVKEEPLDVKIEETEETVFEGLPMATIEADEVIDSSTQYLSVIDYSNITKTGATVKEEPLDLKIEEIEETVYERLPMATVEADEVVDSSTQLLSVIGYSNITSTGATVKEEPLDLKIEETEEIVYERLPMATVEADEVVDSSTQLLSVIGYSNITSTGATIKEEQLDVKIEVTEEKCYEEFPIATEEDDENVYCSNKLEVKNLSEEETKQTNISLFICDKCNQKFFSKHHLIKHLKHTSLQNREKPFSCSRCHKAFKQKSNLTIHMRVHTGEKPYSCSRCENAFHSQSSLTYHMQLHSGENPYSCTKCDKAFYYQSSLTCHMRIHTGEKPYSCSRCDKAFTQKSYLTSHMRVHTGEKPYFCSRCDKAFTQKSYLTSHMRVHTGEKPYSCSRCDKAFHSQTGLTYHMRLHTGEKPYSCSRCNKTFHYPTGLTTHMRAHARENRYSCKRCDEAFMYKSHLASHMQVHIGQPYACRRCDKVFNEENDLTKHMRVHIGETPVPCSRCDKAFKTKSVLKIHMRTHGRENL